MGSCCGNGSEQHRCLDSTEVTPSGVQRPNRMKVDDGISQINDFRSDHHGEFAILDLAVELWFMKLKRQGKKWGAAPTSLRPAVGCLFLASSESIDGHAKDYLGVAKSANGRAEDGRLFGGNPIEQSAVAG